MNATTAAPGSVRSAAQQRAHIGRVGVRVFIASETMFFAALFFAWYYLSVTSGATWPPEGIARPPLAPAIVNTVLTLASAVTIWLAARAIARDDKRGLLVNIVLSAIMGVVFMAVQTIEFAQLAALVQASSYGSLFVFILFFHVVRVFVGVAMMGIVLVRATLHQFSAQRRLLVDATAMYWYFIVSVWLVVFAVLYLK